MGRIRTIKPEAFLDEELWDAEIDTGLPLFRAFTGLWTQADREGRFQWRPRKLKAAVLPYWDGEFSRVLDALTTRGFLVRYASNGDEFGCVRTFSKHQIVNNRELASEIPPPPAEAMNDAALTRASRVDDAFSTALGTPSVEGKGKEQEGKGTGKGIRRDKRASPIGDEFSITDELWNWASAEAPTVDLESATKQFVDHHRAKGSVFKDHNAAWRTWIRNAVKWGPHRPGVSALTQRNIESLRDFVNGSS